MTLYLGDLIDGDTHHFSFTTVDDTGLPFALSGGVLSVYKDANTTETTIGVSVSLSFDGRTGLNLVTLTLTDAFYVPDTDYHVVITTGTVDGVSVVGYVVAEFSISNRMPNVNVREWLDNAVAAAAAGVPNVNITTILNTAPSLTGDDLDVNVIGGVAPLGTAMRGTDGVDTATMRGTDGVDTAAMRGTDLALLAASAPTNFGDLSITLTTGRVDIAAIIGTAPTLSGGNIDTNVATLDVAALTAIEDEILDAIITGVFHNDVNSLGRRIRQLAEAGSYAGGAAFLDTVNGVAGVDLFENGAEVLPSNNMADLNTILAGVGLSRVEVAPGSSVTFVAAQANQQFNGQNWGLVLGGQAVGGSHFSGADVSGTGTCATEAHFEHCELGTMTIGVAHFDECDISGTVTLSDATTYLFLDCFHSGIAVIDFGLLVGNTTVHLHNYHGAIIIENMGQTGTDVLHWSSPDGKLTLAASCVGGTVNMPGTFDFVNNGSGMTLNRGGDAINDIAGVKTLPVSNVALPNIPFLFVSSVDHVTPVTGATTISGQRSIDGGAFVAVAGAITEVGNGSYQFDALAADMNGGIIQFIFSATGGSPAAPDDTFLTIVTGAGV